MMDERKPAAGSTPTRPRRKLYSAPALEKGLDIVELVASEPESMNLKEIAERLGRSVGEIFRMLAVLEQRGYVRTVDGSERYELSMKLFQLSHWHLPVNRLTQAANGPMRRLALRTGQSCHLAILSGTRSLIIAKHDSFRDRNFSIRVGAEAPLFGSCSGRLFFALADAYQRDHLIERINGDTGDTGDAAGAAEIATLEPDIRQNGLLEIPSDILQGITDMGAPVFGHDGSMTAALVIPFLHRKDKDDANEIALARSLLVEASAEITKAVGGNE